jgi:uncharacterized RDD family membrane protein YckC
MLQNTECRYCCQPLAEASAAWCSHCGSRLQPLSMMPSIQGFARFGARFLDICLFEAILALIALPLLLLDLGNPLLIIYIKLSSFLALFTLLPLLEAWCLHRWGATPGKWLLRLEVVGPGGTLPTWKQAVARTVKLYHQLGYFMAAMGLLSTLWLTIWRQTDVACGMLALTAIIVLVGHARVFFHCRKSGGHAHWDESQGLRVNHRVLRFERVMVALLSYFLLIAATQAVAHWPEVTGVSSSVL